MAITWWYVRRMIRKRGTAALAGLIAGEGLSLGRERREAASSSRGCSPSASSPGGRVLVVAAAAAGRGRLGRLGAGRAGRTAAAVRARTAAGTRAAAGPRRHVSDGAGLVRPSLEQIPAADPTARVPAGRRLARPQRGPERPLPGRARGDRRGDATLNRYPARGSAELVAALAERHGVPAAQVIVAAGSRRADRLRLPGGARSRRRGRDPVAVVPELRPRRAEAGRRSRARPARRGGGRDRGAAGRGDPADAARSSSPRRTTRRGSRSRATTRSRSCATSPSTSSPSSTRPTSTTSSRARASIRSPTSPARARRRWRCARSRSCTGSRGCGSATASGRQQSWPRCGRCSAATTSARWRRWRRSRASATRRRRPAAGRRTASRWRRSSRSWPRHGLEPLAGSATNFVLVDVSSDADEAAAALLRHGVAVQSGAPFGAPTSLRIGAGSAAELERLDAALERPG